MTTLFYSDVHINSQRIKNRLLALGLGVFIVMLALFATPIAYAKKKPLIVNDGPYIFYTNEPDTYDVRHVCQNRVLNALVNHQALSKGEYQGCEENSAPIKGLSNQFVRDELIYQGDFDIVAVSDFHGQFELMKALLKNNRVIDEQGNWALGNGHLVITGDVFDRGDKVTEILWFLFQLEQQALAVNGKVHLLVGNHEVMVLNGDLRYLNDKYNVTAGLLSRPFELLYSEDSVLGRWLRSKNVLVKINHDIYLHGGLHHKLTEDKLSLEFINQQFTQSLVVADMERQRTYVEDYLHGRQGPVWYRGYFYWPIIPVTQLDDVLAFYQAKRIIVGHTSYKEIKVRFKGKVIAIDSSIKKGKYGELLKVSNGKYYRLTLDGITSELTVN